MKNHDCTKLTIILERLNRIAINVFVYTIYSSRGWSKALKRAV